MKRLTRSPSTLQTSKLIIVIITTITLLLIFGSIAFSQTSFQSIKGIVLKDGSVIRGKVIEMNASIFKIQTQDGSIQVRKFDDVQTFVKDDREFGSKSSSYSGYQSTTPALTGGYVGIWGGYTFSPDATYERSSYSFDLDVKETWALGFKLGYTPPQAKYFSFEFEFSYLSPDIDRTVLAQAGTDYVSIDEASATLKNFMFNVIAKYPEGRIHPYLGVGLGLSYVEVDGTFRARLGAVNYTAYDSDDDMAFAWQILAGVDIDLTNNLVLDLGYRYFYTKPQFEVTEIEYKTSMFTAGLKFLF